MKNSLEQIAFYPINLDVRRSTISMTKNEDKKGTVYNALSIALDVVEDFCVLPLKYKLFHGLA